MKDSIKTIALVLLLAACGASTMMYLGTVSLLDSAEMQMKQQQEQIALLEERQTILVEDMTRLEDQLAARYDDIQALEGQIAYLLEARCIRETLANATPEEKYKLKKLGQAEAGNQGVVGIALVMLSVVNRVEHPTKYADTLDGVIFSGAYTVTQPGGGYWTAEPSEECDVALYLIEHGWTEADLLSFMGLDEELKIYYFTNSGYSYGDPIIHYRNHYFSGYTVVTE